MESNLKLTRIWGIPIGLNNTWFLIFALVTFSLATGYFPTEYPQLSVPTYWFLGLLTSILFFGSVLAHELGHALIALRNQIQVRGITLFIFGGVAQIEKEPSSPGVEFRIAIAGPIVSLALAGVFMGLWLLDRSIPLLAAPSAYLMRINLILALFNMIPGFPLDGGRVLRAILWKLSGDFRKSTQIASTSGQVVAYGFIGMGIFSMISGQFFNGLWLAFIGWFLQNAANAASAQVNLQHALQGIKVSQIMSRGCTRIPSLTPISQLVEGQILSGGERCFFVADNGKLEGLLTLRDVAAIPRQRWGFTTSRQAMVPADRLVQVHPDTELLEALRTMDSANVAQVPVMEAGELVGMLSRENVVHYMRARAELGI
jgi:Zn-dependent protease